MTEHLADGVYFDLPEELYFPQALGSTDFKTLYQQREGWWWQSDHNPHHTEPENKYKARGHAFHCWLLEGVAAFEMRYAILPERSDFPDLLDTIDDMKAALRTYGASMPSSGRKKDFEHYCRQYLPKHPLWTDVMEQFNADHPDKQYIDATTARHIAAINDTIQSEPVLSALLDPPGPPLVELSVFWTRPNGIRCRFRFDALFPNFALDLKGIETTGAQELKQAAAFRIRDMDMDLQAALSFEARAAVYRAIEEKRINGGSKDQRAWLRRFPKQAQLNRGDGMTPGWAWLWLFVQWPNDQSGRAPEALPVWMNFGDAKHTDGVRKYLHAMDTYQAAVAKFGLSTPWHRAHPVHGLTGQGVNQLQMPIDYNPPMRHDAEDELLNPRRKI